MKILITLAPFGEDLGPFDLYSDVDNYAIPFDTNILASEIEAGYTSILAPDTALIIRTLSTGTCTNYLDLVLPTTTTTTTIALTTTTTTTAAGIQCEEIVSSGGYGVTDETIVMASDTELTGGIVIIDFSAISVPDKLEIIHNGVKVATTGIAGGNAGPFDNVWGDPASNYPQNSGDVAAIDQFIGDGKPGSNPSRNAEFLADTGIPGVTASKQQLIWWEYTTIDYAVSTNITIRVVGYPGTAWNLLRQCPATTTTTTTTSPTTTTTTTVSPTTTTTTTISPTTTTTTTIQ